MEESDQDQSSSLERSSAESEIGENYPASSLNENQVNIFHDCGHTRKDRSSNMVVRAKWLYEPDEKDQVSSSHFRKILRCSSQKPQNLMGLDYVEISVWGESFMLHQVSV